MPVTAEEMFKQNPDLKKDDLNHIKEWLSRQPHLPKDVTDEMLITMMNRCYFSLEQSKQFIDSYYTLRTHLPEFFNDRNLDCPEIKRCLDAVHVFLLDHKTKDGYLVLMTTFKNNDPELFSYGALFKLSFMVADALLLNMETFPGVIIVIDFKGVKLGHVAKVSLPLLKKFVTYMQDGIPARLKGFNFINVVPITEKVVAMMKPFMKKELMDILELHIEGSDTLYKHVPKEIIPPELGGSGTNVERLSERTRKLLADTEEWYLKDEKHRVDESKRPGKAKSAGDLFGIEGSFRKLAID